LVSARAGKPASPKVNNSAVADRKTLFIYSSLI
jgi:hypothetical protein